MQNTVYQRNKIEIQILLSAFSYLFPFGNSAANGLVTEKLPKFALF